MTRVEDPNWAPKQEKKEKNAEPAGAEKSASATPSMESLMSVGRQAQIMECLNQGGMVAGFNSDESVLCLRAR